MTSGDDRERFKEPEPPCAYGPCAKPRAGHASGLCTEHIGLLDFVVFVMNHIQLQGRTVMQVLATTANAQNQIERAQQLQHAQQNAKLLNLNGKPLR